MPKQKVVEIEQCAPSKPPFLMDNSMNLFHLRPTATFHSLHLCSAEICFQNDHRLLYTKEREYIQHNTIQLMFDWFGLVAFCGYGTFMSSFRRRLNPLELTQSQQSRLQMLLQVG